MLSWGQVTPSLAYLNDTEETIPAEVFVYLGKVRDSERFTGEIQSWKDRFNH